MMNATQKLSPRENRVVANALLLMIEKTRCDTGDYLRRLITVAQKRLDSLQ